MICLDQSFVIEITYNKWWIHNSLNENLVYIQNEKLTHENLNAYNENKTTKIRFQGLITEMFTQRKFPAISQVSGQEETRRGTSPVVLGNLTTTLNVVLRHLTSTVVIARLRSSSSEVLAEERDREMVVPHATKTNLTINFIDTTSRTKLLVDGTATKVLGLTPLVNLGETQSPPTPLVSRRMLPPAPSLTAVESIWRMLFKEPNCRMKAWQMNANGTLGRYTTL